MRIQPESVIIRSSYRIIDALKKLNRPGSFSKTLFVTDNSDKLIGSLTDGDIRRAFINGFTTESTVDEVCQKPPVFAFQNTSDEQIDLLTQGKKIFSLPIIDEQGKITRILKTGEDGSEDGEGLAIIMAGGEGMRLRPLTENIPKPMLKVGNKPILQILIESLRDSGYTEILINIRYLSGIITDYFKDGSDFNVKIDYITEPKPMGTAGSLGIIPPELRPDSSFLVINGDLLTTLNFKSFRDFHDTAGYDFTLCGRPYKVKIPFGYPVIEGDIVTAFREKPEFTHFVNSGIYCISPELLDKVPENKYFDMPDLIQVAIENQKRVGVFPLREVFHEVGRPETYENAEEFYNNHLNNSKAI